MKVARMLFLILLVVALFAFTGCSESGTNIKNKEYTIEEILKIDPNFEEGSRNAVFKQGNFEDSEIFVSGNYKYIVSEDGKYASVIEYIGDESTAYVPYVVDGKFVVAVQGYETAMFITNEDGEEELISTFIYPFNNKANLTKIVFPDSVRYIGNVSVFCPELQELEFSDNLVRLGSGSELVMSKYMHIKEIVLPEGLEVISDCAFQCAYELEKISFPSTLKHIGRQAFLNCTSLKSVEINCKEAVICDSAFSNCISLETVTLSAIKEINASVFRGCEALTSVTLPEGLTKIAYDTFGECESLTSIVIPESVELIERGAFIGCTNIKSVTVYDTTVLENNAFDSELGELSESDILKITTVAEETTDEEMPEEDKDYIDRGYCGGEGNGKNLTWTLDNDGTLTIRGSGNMADSSDISPFDNYASQINRAVLMPGVTSIGSRAFEDCISLTEVTIPDSVTKIGDSAFYCCESLTEITIPNSVINIGEWAFAYCSGLTGITIPDSVSGISDWTFEQCTGLTSVIISNGVTSIGECAFLHCTGLETIIIPDSVTYVSDYAFDRCASLHDIYCIAESQPTGWGPWWNEGCSAKVRWGYEGSSTDILPDGYCGGEGNGENLSWTSDSAGTLTISGSGKMKDYDRGKSPFYSDTIKSVVLMPGVTNIGAYAFHYCRDLTSVEIPNSVTIICNGAFNECYIYLQ